MMTTAMAGITTVIMAAITTTIGAGMTAMIAAMGVATIATGMMTEPWRNRLPPERAGMTEMDAIVAIQ